MQDLEYDDKELQRIFAALTPQERKKMFRAAFRRTGAKVRKIVQEKLMGSGLHNASKLKGSVRIVTFRKDAGFRVTVAGRRGRRSTGKGERSMYLPSRMERRKAAGKYWTKLPVLQWAEPGTDPRYTRGKCHTRLKVDKLGRIRRKKVYDRNLYRGKMKRYGFVSGSRVRTESLVREELPKDIQRQLDKIGKK